MVYAFETGLEVRECFVARDGLDVEFRATNNNVEKIFTVGPGRDPSEIHINVPGCNNLTIDGAGQLVVSKKNGWVAFTAPVAFQEIDGEREGVPVRYRVDGDTYGFEVGTYDKTQPLVIDPLLASTYFGGTNDDNVAAVAIATNGDVYIAGSTDSLDLPTTAGSYDRISNVMIYTNADGDEARTRDIFVAKFDSGLTTLLGATFLGGDDNDDCSDIALDQDGNVYVLGASMSSNFPVTATAYSTNIHGSMHYEDYSARYEYNDDIVIAKFDPNLTNLLAATYLGGTNYDSASKLVIDGSGRVLITGSTASSNFPTTADAYDGTYHVGSDVGIYRTDVDIIVSVFDSDLTNLLASTYLGGDGYDESTAMAVDEQTNIYITGYTTSTNFPTTVGVFDVTINTNQFGDYYPDGFVAKFNANLSELRACTLLGGTEDESIFDLILGHSNDLYVGGQSWSTNFPVTAGAFHSNVFEEVDYGLTLSRMDTSLSNLLSSTFIETDGNETVNTYLALTRDGQIYMAGYNYNGGIDPFVTSGSYYFSSTSGPSYILRMNADLSCLLLCTQLALSDIDAIALDSDGRVYCVGVDSQFEGSASDEMETFANSYQSQHAAGENDDGFVLCFDKTVTITPEVAISKSAPGLTLQWSSATNVTYALWRSTNLLNGFTEAVQTNISGTPPYNTVNVTNGSGNNAYFYEIGIE